MNLELKKAIDQISKDKGLDRDMLIDTLEDAVRTSVLRRFSEDMDVEVSYNDNTGDIEVYQFKIVVEDDDLLNPDTQIELSEARTHDPSVQIDDEMGFRVKVEDLGRIAAQSAKQVIIQRMRDAEQEIIYEEYKDRVGEIVYWPSRHSFATLYAQNGEVFDMQRIGRIEWGLEELARLGDAEVTITLEK